MNNTASFQLREKISGLQSLHERLNGSILDFTFGIKTWYGASRCYRLHINIVSTDHTRRSILHSFWWQ